MLTKLYYRLHRMTSKPGERGEYSSGYWPDLVRKETLILCGGRRGRVLEVGCGEGLFLTQLARLNPELEIWGIDNDNLRLKEAEKKYKEKNFKNINLALQEAASLPFEDEYFDTAICINVFFNMDSISTVTKTLSQTKRVCKKSGRIIFDFRNSLNPLLAAKYKLARYYDPTVKNLPLKTYHPAQVEAILKELNLNIINKRFIGSFFKKIAPVIIIESEKV